MQKLHDQSGQLFEIFVYHSITSGNKVSEASFMLSSAQEEPQFYELFENVLLGFLSEIISETLQEPIETFLQLFKEKRIKCSDLS